MTDIEKIQKINEMSQYLKKHGFAASSEEAVEQAQDFYKGKFEAIQPTKKVDSEEQKSEGEEKVAESNEDVSKVMRNFEVFKSSTQKQIDSMSNELSTVIGKMNEMIKTINELEKLKDSVTSIDEGEEKQQRLAPKVVKKPASEKPSGTTHPRSGNVQPGDVDISKTFYYGNK